MQVNSPIESRFHRLANASQVRWKADVEGLTRGRPLVARDTVVVNAGPISSRVSGTDRQGHTRWTAEQPSDINDIPVSDSRGKVFVGTRDGGFMRLDPTTGKADWNIKDYDIFKLCPPERRGSFFDDFTGSQGRPALSPDQKTVYFGTFEGTLVAADADSGAVRWHLTRPQTMNHADPTVARDGSIYYTDDQGYLAKASTEGKLQWEKRLAEGLLGLTRAVIDDRQQVCVGSKDGRLLVVDPERGEVARSFQADGAIRVDPVCDSVTGRLYVSSDKGTVYCLERNGDKDFRTVWSQTQQHPVTDMALDPQGRLCLATRDSGLTIYEPDGSLYGLIAGLDSPTAVTPEGEGRYLVGGDSLMEVQPTLASLEHQDEAEPPSEAAAPSIELAEDYLSVGDVLLAVEH